MSSDEIKRLLRLSKQEQKDYLLSKTGIDDSCGTILTHIHKNPIIRSYAKDLDDPIYNRSCESLYRNLCVIGVHLGLVGNIEEIKVKQNESYIEFRKKQEWVTSGI